jgi:peptide/nickel transport system substrate-binding protein
VKFSLDRARADDSTNAQKALFADIASVEVVDPATVKVTLSKPNGSFLFNMAWGDAVIVAPESAADNAANPVGTGPFTLTEWVKGDRVDLVRYRRLLGRSGRARQGDLQVHLRPDRGLCRDDGGRS